MSADSVIWPALSQEEEQLSNAAERLWRQVHPIRLHNGRISSDAFQPGSSDNKQLSCSREDKTTPEDAHAYHTEKLGLESAGCAVVTVEEVEAPHPASPNGAEVARLRAVDDSATAAEGAPLPPGHVYLDYRPYGSSRISRKSKQLAFFANRRGFIEA